MLFSAFSCAEHSPAYNASYERYKKAGRKADRLGRSARMRPSDIQHLRSDEIEPCRTWVRAYVRALTEELRLRRKHATQLIGTREYHVIAAVNVVSMDGAYACI